MKHKIDLPDRPKISLFGCGGTGSHVLLGLPRAYKAITDLGGQGFHVNAYDPDKVESRNVGRQAFTLAEVGVNKSHALIDRINMYYRYNWHSHAEPAPAWSHADIIISCVDTGRSRKQIAESTMHGNPYIIDCGNAKYSGQVLIGRHEGELTDPYKDNPELMVEDTDEAPTCGDPYSEQDLFINQIIATYALDFLWTLLHCEYLEKRGVFVDLKKGITNPLS
jgi:PRTRC genetic system ThiF family protein